MRNLYWLTGEQMTQLKPFLPKSHRVPPIGDPLPGRQLEPSARGTKLHAVTGENGRTIRFVMTAGPASDYSGAAALLGGLPAAIWLLASWGNDADPFRECQKN